MDATILEIESEEFEREEDANDWQYRGLIEQAAQIHPMPETPKNSGLLWKFDYNILSYEVQNVGQYYKAFASIECEWK